MGFEDEVAAVGETEENGQFVDAMVTNFSPLSQNEAPQVGGFPSMTVIENLAIAIREAEESGNAQAAGEAREDLQSYLAEFGIGVEEGPTKPTTTEIPEGWPPPPNEDDYKSAALGGFSQWDPLVYDYEIDGVAVVGTGCGLFAASNAVNALGYPNSEFEVCFPIFADASGNNGYVPNAGISPSDYEATVRAIVENIVAPSLGASGEVYVFQGGTAEEGIERIRQELLKGNEVIVDILAEYAVENDLGGTKPISGGPLQDDNGGSFAHFTRVVGFSEDGQTIYLAESLKPASTNWGDLGITAIVAVPIEIFMASWQNPEGRANGNFVNGIPIEGYTIEEVYNWMLVISPPNY